MGTLREPQKHWTVEGNLVVMPSATLSSTSILHATADSPQYRTRSESGHSTTRIVSLPHVDGITLHRCVSVLQLTMH